MIQARHRGNKVRRQSKPRRTVPSPAAEAAAADAVEVLIGQLNENLGRVVDLFHLWDDDESGTITKKEFRNGIVSALGVKPGAEELAALFARLDPDDSGTIDYRELDAKLRRREVRHAASREASPSPSN